LLTRCSIPKKGYALPVAKMAANWRNTDMTIEVLTGKGWVDIPSEDYVIEHTCCDCSDYAEHVTDCGRGPDGSRVLWAQCSDCYWQIVDAIDDDDVDFEDMLLDEGEAVRMGSAAASWLEVYR